MRMLLRVATLTLAMASMQAPAQSNQLPSIGSSAGEVLGPADQKAYGELLLAQLRHYGYILEDPLVDGWLRTLGQTLGASSDQPKQSLTFFMLKDRQVNAFATVGGYVGANAGLVLTAESEDEVAAVLAHEVAHVTQSHVLRGVERAQKDSVPILLAMIGAIAVAQAAGGNSGDNASMAALASAQGLMAQRQIDFTRSNEAEADRLGIRTLARSGYDPDAMASMFTRLQALSRANQGGDRERTPDYLQSHPVTTTRISEAKQRAEQIGRENITLVTTTPGNRSVERRPRDGFTLPDARTDNPLLPGSLSLAGIGDRRGGSGQFEWVRERLRVLSADTPDAAIRDYERLRRSAAPSDAERYGLALAQLLDGQAGVASATLTPLAAAHPDNLFVGLALAQADARGGRLAAADARFEAMLARMPNNRAVALGYATALGERNTREGGLRAMAVLRPLASAAAEDPLFHTAFARASEIAGDPVRAGEAYAEAAYYNGRPEQALVQLNTLKRRPDLDYYARARIDARIAAITPQVLELRRQGIRDDDLRRD